MNIDRQWCRKPEVFAKGRRGQTNFLSLNKPLSIYLHDLEVFHFLGINAVMCATVPITQCSIFVFKNSFVLLLITS